VAYSFGIAVLAHPRPCSVDRTNPASNSAISGDSSQYCVRVFGVRALMTARINLRPDVGFIIWRTLQSQLISKSRSAEGSTFRRPNSKKVRETMTGTTNSDRFSPGLGFSGSWWVGVWRCPAWSAISAVAWEFQHNSATDAICLMGCFGAQAVLMWRPSFCYQISKRKHLVSTWSARSPSSLSHYYSCSVAPDVHAAHVARFRGQTRDS